MALAYLRDRFPAVRHVVAQADLRAGLVAGSLLAVGIGLGAAHIAAERRGSAIAAWSRRAKLASIVPAVGGAILFFSWLPLDHRGDSGIAWRLDEATALAEARAAGRPVLITSARRGAKDATRSRRPPSAIRASAQSPGASSR